MTKYTEASAHGRFQPFHRDHLKYLLAAIARCEFLWVGITQFNVRNIKSSPADKHREVPHNNPLTFFERMSLITSSLVEAGVARDAFAVIPFPIDEPNVVTDFLPKHIPILTTVCDQWNKYKIQELQNRGYTVEILWEKAEKDFEGARVRDALMHGDARWEQMVPPITIDLIKGFELKERLIRLRDYGFE